MKKIITTVMALTLAFGMSVTVLAAPSPSKDGTKPVNAFLDGESMDEGTAERADEILAETPVTVKENKELVSSASDALTAQKAEIVEKIKFLMDLDGVKGEVKADELTVLTVYDVTVPPALTALMQEDTGAYLWVQIPVAGIKKGDIVGALHYDGTKWTPIDAYCWVDGIVSVCSRDFSPVAILGISPKQTTPTDPTGPTNPTGPTGPTGTNQSYDGWAGWDHSTLWAAQAGTTSPKTGETGVVGFALVAVACGAALVFTKKKFA